ncbi:MAG: FlgD immunoglobulin-like domain containing protein, partial [Calditrichota bacterium]
SGKIYLIGGFSGDPQNPSDKVFTFDLEPIIGLEPQINIPADHILASAYPNPFNGFVNLDLQISAGGMLRLIIFDTNGKKIKTIYDGRTTAGDYSFNWNGLNENEERISSGIYFALYELNARKGALKLIYVR